MKVVANEPPYSPDVSTTSPAGIPEKNSASEQQYSTPEHSSLAPFPDSSQQESSPAWMEHMAFEPGDGFLLSKEQ